MGLSDRYAPCGWTLVRYDYRFLQMGVIGMKDLSRYMRKPTNMFRNL